ncbi:hypothetical protein B0H14DRAFT_1168108 [Mycena olivaceomarginata]|nr:hypothetical protein B0H14DRAFT_1168108 [Mycena olivaceomarginata]
MRVLFGALFHFRFGVRIVLHSCLLFFLSPVYSLHSNFVKTNILFLSFKSKKSSNRSQSRSPPPIAPVLPSCLRSPSIPSASPPSPSSPSDPEPARSFSALGTTASISTSGDTPTSTSTSDAPSSTPSLPRIDTSSASLSAPPSAHPSAPPPSPRTPLRLPTPPPPPPLAALLTVYTTPIQSTSATVSAPLSAAPANAAARERTVPLRACCAECAAGAKMEVREEAFSRGALRVRRRAALLGGGVGGDTLFEAARRGGFLDIPAAEGANQQLLSGTGLAEVTRLVAELELRRSRSATPSPGGTPPVSPVEYAHAHGRASPSLLGPALARLADGGEGGAYGERLTPGDATHGSRSGSGRASPLLPLGIAVDEVDKERRRRSEDFGALGHGHSAIGIAMAGAAAVNLAEEDEFDGEQTQTMHGKPPSPQILYEHVSAASGFPFASSSSSGQPSSAPAGSTSFSSTAGERGPEEA